MALIAWTTEVPTVPAESTMVGAKEMDVVL